MIPSPLTPEEIAAVRRPYRAASLLPGRAYHDPAIHDFERERWFRRDWLVVGGVPCAERPVSLRATPRGGLAWRTPLACFEGSIVLPSKG